MKKQKENAAYQKASLFKDSLFLKNHDTIVCFFVNGKVGEFLVVKNQRGEMIKYTAAEIGPYVDHRNYQLSRARFFP